ncbi:rubrerythrin family protein [Acidobacteriota bacterium]
MGIEDNLQAAFAGESQANRKYLAFAKKADDDGFPNIAKLFRAAAGAETVHAHAHLRVMKGVKGTEENLQEAIEGEGYEYKEMYPDFVKEAESAGDKPAEITFKNALAVEKIHHDMYTDALASFKAGSDLPDKQIWVCEVCGNTVYGGAPDTCPICNAPKARFFEIN